jgi:predicted RNA-binding Zn ribbon-like protein
VSTFLKPSIGYTGVETEPKEAIRMTQHIREGVVPDEIKVVNEFLNTLDLERFGEHARKPEEEREELRSPETLKRWLVERGLLGEEEVVTEADRELAVGVRDVLRSAARANSSGAPTNKQHPEDAGRVLGVLPLLVHLEEDLRPKLVPGTNGVRGALGRIVADVVIAASKGTWERLKICNAEDCQWAYYDHSKSRTGRWCAMETCGNRHKTRRYRRRRAQPS